MYPFELSLHRLCSFGININWFVVGYTNFEKQKKAAINITAFE